MKNEASEGTLVCVIENFTRRKISEKDIETVVRETVRAMQGRVKAEGTVLHLYVHIVGVLRSAHLNQKFRDIQKPADVLSFPVVWPKVDGSLVMDSIRRGPRHVACEIVLCPQIIEQHAKKSGRSFQDEWTHALVHGTLHVLGHHHEESAKRERDLQQKENSICKKLGYGMPHPELLNSKFKITSSK